MQKNLLSDKKKSPKFNLRVALMIFLVFRFSSISDPTKTRSLLILSFFTNQVKT